MAYVFDGASGEINYGFPSSINDLMKDGDLTISCVIRPDTIGEASGGRIMTKRQTGAGGFLWYMAPTNSMRFTSLTSATGTCSAQVGANSQIAMNVWSVVAITCPNSTHKANIFNGASEISYTSDTVTSTPGGDATGNFFVGASAAVPDLRTFDGDIAEVAFWTRVLSTSELEALDKGYSPLFFPQNLVFYAPLVSHPNDIVGGVAGTVDTAVNLSGDHPRVIYPDLQRFWFVPAAAGGLTASVSETYNFSSTVASLGHYSSAVADGLSTSDTTSSLGHYGAAVTDGFSASDAPVSLGHYLAVAADTAQAQDTIVALIHALASVDDTVNFSDVISAIISGAQLADVADTFNISESVVALAAKLASVSDTITAADVVVALSALIAAQSDTLTFSDSVVATTITASSVLDTLNLSDAAIALRHLLGVVIGAVTYADTIAATGAYTASVADTLNFSSTLSYPAEGNYLHGVIVLQNALAGAVTITGELDGTFTIVKPS